MSPGNWQIPITGVVRLNGFITGWIWTITGLSPLRKSRKPVWRFLVRIYPRTVWFWVQWAGRPPARAGRAARRQRPARRPGLQSVRRGRRNRGAGGSPARGHPADAATTRRAPAHRCARRSALRPPTPARARWPAARLRARPASTMVRCSSASRSPCGNVRDLRWQRSQRVRRGTDFDPTTTARPGSAVLPAGLAARIVLWLERAAFAGCLRWMALRLQFRLGVAGARLPARIVRLSRVRRGAGCGVR